MITISDLDLAAIAIRETTLLVAVPEARMVAPLSGSGKTQLYRGSREVSTINLVVADLLRIRSSLQKKFLSVSVFYHTGQENFIADDDSCLFDVSETSFHAHMSVV